MRPIKIIRNKIDGDLQKYSNITICEIMDVMVIKGVGKVLKLAYSNFDDETVNPIYVPCVNMNGEWPHKVKEKYNAAVISVVNNQPSTGFALLIPKTSIEDTSLFDKKDSDKVDSEHPEGVVDKKVS